MRINVLIGGTDRGYIRVFVDFLTKSNNNQFNMTVMTEIEPFLGAATADRFDLYLFEEDFYLKMVEDLPSIVIPKTIVLTEPMTAIDSQSVKAVLKYQSAIDIEGAVINYYLNSTSDELMPRVGARAKLVTFYGPSGGAGTTTVAQIFAQQKSAKGFKVLFVSLEELPSYYQMYHSLKQANMSDYLVHLLSNTNWLLGLERMVSVDDATGVQYFKPANNGMDLAEVDPSLWERWMTYMREMSDYNYLVIDLGCHLFRGGIDVLKVSDYRVYITRDDSASAVKWQTFQRQVDQLVGEQLLQHKTVFCSQLIQRHQTMTEGVDALLPFDAGLVKPGKEGQEHLNPQSDVYRRVGECLNHV